MSAISPMQSKSDPFKSCSHLPLTEPLLIHIAQAIKNAENLPAETSQEYDVGGLFPNGTIWEYDTDKKIATIYQMMPISVLLGLSHPLR